MLKVAGPDRTTPREGPRCVKESTNMNLEQFLTRAAQLVRIGLPVSAIVGMLLGGAADAYWI